MSTARPAGGRGKPAPALMRPALILLAALLLGLALAPTRPARAVQFTNDGRVPAGTLVDDDLFISATNAEIDGTVNGDLFINAEVATINGRVNGNLMVYSAALVLTGEVTGSLVFAGQGAELSGAVGGSVYAAGNILRLQDSAAIQRNLYFAGYALETLPGASIGRDLSMAGYQAVLAGEQVRNVRLSVNRAELNGAIQGDALIEVSVPGAEESFTRSLNEMLPPLPGIDSITMLDSGLHVGPQAQIDGRLVYSSPADQSAAILAQPAGGVEFTQKQSEPSAEAAAQTAVLSWFTSAFQELATLLILAGLAAGLLPGLLNQAADQAGLQPLRSAWLGLRALIGGLAAALAALLLVLLAGILLGVVSLGALSRAVLGIGLSGVTAGIGVILFLAAFGSKLVVAQWSGARLLQRLSPGLAEHRYWPVVCGVALYVLLRLIPGVHILVGLAATLVGLGGLWQARRASFTRFSSPSL
ncbi:MAG: hypothetical protein ACKOC5_07600 [Chloroflexota bacterium]